jgi:type IV fimbrial biogenesis protein FimT
MQMGRLVNRRTSAVVRYRSSLRQAGVSLFEAITTLGIASIVGVTALPAMLDMIANQRMTTAVNSFMTDLVVTRSTAISQGATVILCPGTPEVGCADTMDFAQGVIVFVDIDENNDFTPGAEPLVRVTEALPQGLKAKKNGLHTRIEYRLTGWSPGMMTSVTFCDSRGPAHGRRVTLNMAGRPYVAREHINGGPLSC